MDDTTQNPADEPGTSGDAGDLGHAAVEQFQRAALDAVRAARAFLDAAESVIREPAAIEAMVDTVAAFARTASESVADFASSASRRHAPDASESGDGEDGDGDGGYESIRVE